uniref:Uncharacterized protein n=1 Tax=Timema poppense TaxID=170557 RepID=A0A7R9DUA8_TIMPO|nr:unnamed protein product [Timema poppensis]
MFCLHLVVTDVIRSAGRQDSANSNCHCPSLCEQTTFSIVLTKELVGMQCLVNNFHFPLTLVQYKRQILFSDMDLLVSFGGIINLFLGLSLLSSVEVVYYLIFRLPSTLWRRRAPDSGDARTSGVDPAAGVFCTSERRDPLTSPAGTGWTVRARYKQRLVFPTPDKGAKAFPGPMKRGERRGHGEYQGYIN